MVDYPEILRLKNLGYSQRDIITSVHCSCHTIKAIVDAAAEINLDWPLDEDITNQDLRTLLFLNKYKSESIYVESDYSYIHKELVKHGVNLTLLWEEYRQKCYDNRQTPYMYTQFVVKYNKLAHVTNEAHVRNGVAKTP